MVNDKKEVLPSSLPRKILTPKGMVQSVYGTLVPVYCPNCGTRTGYVLETELAEWCVFCRLCAAKWGALANEMNLPIEQFLEEFVQVQLELYGRILSTPEVTALIKQDDSPLAAFIKSRKERKQC